MSNYELKLQSYSPLKILTSSGEVLNNQNLPTLSDLDLKELMTRMVFTRTWDERASGLAKQGRLGFYAPVAGQEASMIGSQYTLSSSDWILPGYRDLPQLYWHGYPMYQAFLWSRGHQHGGQIPDNINILMPQIIIGAQFVQAVGVAMGLSKRGLSDVVITYTGDGGSSEGDFYEAMNFAGVYHLPVVFIVQNNGYAISTPRKLQTRAESIAQKGLAAGITSVQVDGMDILAVYKVVNEAVNRARLGQGPTLIESITYRLGAHSMSGDDPTRYRPKEELELWTLNDPLTRFRKYLINLNLWTHEEEQEVIEQSKKLVTEAVKKADEYPKMNMDELIDSMFEITPIHLQNQKEWFR